VLNYAFSSTPFQWVELLNNGLAVPNAFGVTGTADDWANPVPLGSNTINFYGNTFSGATALWASSNGLLTFGSGNSSFIPGDLLTNPGQAAISPLWMDLYDFDANHLMISAEIDSVNNRLIIEWDHVHDWVTSNYITFEVIIQLNTGNTPGSITFNYSQLDYFKGSAASIGIKDGGSQGPNDVVSIKTANPLVDNNQAILFAWQLPGPRISSLSTTTASEGSSDLSFTVSGNNFTSSSLVQANGATLTTSFLSNTQLQATLPASLLAEEGSLSVTVLTPGTSGGTSNSVPFNVTDTALIPSGQFVSATEGQTLTGGLVATFTDAGSDGTATDYSATVTWDDGNGQSHTSSGTVKLLPGNTFAVYADNTVPYAEEGTHGVTVVIRDKGGSQATVTSEVLVGDAALTANGTNLSATEGAAFTGPVATFNDRDPNAALGDYTATINWGDGQTSTGTIALGATGGFVVSGSHTYADEGTYAVSVQIQDVGGAAITATGSALIGDAALSAQGTSISATEGAAFSGAVATFTDANASAPASDFTVTITWGDGSSSPGTVTANGGGQFTVTGTHTYAEEGSFPISVSITDDGGASASASSSASVADALLSATGTTVNPVEGTNFTGVVAGFTDADPNGTTTDYHATIDWGDGTTSVGSIQVDPKGGFDVVGSHAYRKEGTTSITVTVQDMGGSNNTATASSTAVTNDAPLTATGVIASATEGVAFTGTVASFSDGDAFAVPAGYVVTIGWGDGTTGSGTVVVNTAGGFLVVGTHTYAEEGSRAVNVNILDDGGSSASVSTTVNIGDANLSASGLTIAATEGTAFSGPVATFTDANSGGTVSDFSATIAWGDGITTAGTVSANGGGSFSVSGAHTYAEEGTYSLTVTITDVGGAGAVANSTAQAGDAALTASANPVATVEGGTFSGVVASFTDANPNASASDFTALITWGDGHSSAGVINATGNGSFTISGANSYAEEGSESISVQITDVGGAKATASTTANVADAALQAAGTTVSATEGNLFAGSVASFTDANLGSTAADFTATISWGDGSSGTGSIVPLGNGQYAVRGSHTYADEGNYTVGVQITDAGKATASATSQATVADAALTTTAGSISSVEGGSFSGVVASFTDANPGAGLGDFSATISWGDGTSSTGIVSANNFGGFDVSGSHSYGIEGTLGFSVTITDKGGSAATATGAANVADAPLSATGVSLTEIQGVAFTEVVASFTDANLLGAVTDFKAIISWGDGTSSNGTVSPNGAGSFSVVASHTYTLGGSFSVTVQIFDAGGASATANSSVKVIGMTATGTTLNAIEGQSFAAVVANFSDAYPNLTAKDFSAVITWGDGTTSAGSIAANNNGGYSVTGTHTYATEGSAAITVLLQDSVGATAQANSTALIADGVPVVHATVHHHKHQHRVTLIGSFSDSALENHTVVVSWGDGTSTVMDLGVSWTGQFTLEHDYSGHFLAKHHGLVHITITVLDNVGTSSAPQVLNVNFNNGHHHFSEDNHHGKEGDIWNIPGIDFFS
jgi:hypothetical protein